MEKSKNLAPGENKKEPDDQFATLCTSTLTWQIHPIEPPPGSSTR